MPRGRKEITPRQRVLDLFVLMDVPEQAALIEDMERNHRFCATREAQGKTVTKIREKKAPGAAVEVTA